MRRTRRRLISRLPRRLRCSARWAWKFPSAAPITGCRRVIELDTHLRLRSPLPEVFMRTFLLFGLIALGACSLSAQGKERWSVKSGVPEKTNFSKPGKVALTDLLALKDADGVTHNDRRFQDSRIPGVDGDKFPEGRLVTTTGWLHLV